MKRRATSNEEIEFNIQAKSETSSSPSYLTPFPSLTSSSTPESGIFMRVDLPALDIKSEPENSYAYAYPSCSCACNSRVLELEKEVSKLNSISDKFYEELKELKNLFNSLDDKPQYTVTSISDAPDDEYNDVMPVEAPDFENDESYTNNSNNESLLIEYDAVNTDRFMQSTTCVFDASKPGSSTSTDSAANQATSNNYESDRIDKILYHVQKNTEMIEDLAKKFDVHCKRGDTHQPEPENKPSTSPKKTVYQPRNPSVGKSSSVIPAMSIPTKTIQEVRKLNRKLEDPEFLSEMSKMLQPKGTPNSLRRECNALMKRLLDYEVAALFNWTGKNKTCLKKRYPFSVYSALCALIEDVLIKRCKKNPKEIREAIIHFFKKANDRCLKRVQIKNE